jgi:Xaa-Pro aminopeptidase
MNLPSVDFTPYFKKSQAILISSSSHIGYLTGYTSFSIEEREAYLLLTKSNKYIITDPRYSEAVSRLEGFKLIEISGAKNLSEHLKDKVVEHQISVLAIEENDLKVSELRKIEKIVKQIVDINLHDIRSIKTPDQIAKIASSCAIGDRVFKSIFKKIKTGISENKIAMEMELMMRKLGGVPSFQTIVAFGSNSSVPHHKTGNSRLHGDGEFVLLDFGVKIDDYCSDMTRTIFLGKARVKQKKIYQAVLAAQSKAAEFLDYQIKKGIKVTGKEVDQVAREYIVSKGYPSIPHSLGHGIGLQVHEYPSLSPKSEDVLVEGMVFSIEPGIYIPGFGGVRIEDLYVIGKTGLRQLTQARKELIEL